MTLPRPPAGSGGWLRLLEFPLCVLGCIHYFRRPLCPPHPHRAGVTAHPLCTPALSPITSPCPEFIATDNNLLLFLSFERLFSSLLPKSRGRAYVTSLLVSNRTRERERERDSFPSFLRRVVHRWREYGDRGREREVSHGSLTRLMSRAHGNTICGSRRVSPPRVRSRRFI